MLLASWALVMDATHQPLQSKWHLRLNSYGLLQVAQVGPVMQEAAPPVGPLS